MNSYQKTFSIFSVLIISSLFLTACESLNKIHLGPKLGIKIPIQKDLPLEQDTISANNADKENPEATDDNATVMFAQLGNSEEIEGGTPAMSNKSYLGSGKFTTKPAKKTAVKSQGSALGGLSFDAADIGEICKIILSDELGENYIISPKVKGTITIQTTKPLYKDDLLPTLEMILRMNGAVLIKHEGIYRIEPEAKGIHAANVSLNNHDKLVTGYQIKIIPLAYVGVIDMAEIIKPVVPKNAILRIDPTRNILFVAGTREELEKIIDLVNTFDVNYLAGMSFGLFPLENTEVGSTVVDIENIFNKGEQNPLSGMIRFITIKHLNAILVISQQKAYLREAEKWIRRLDQQNGVIGEGGVIVYKVQHVDATELAATLSSVISGIAPTKSKSISVAPGQKIARLSNKTRRSKKIAQITTSRSQGNTSLEGVTIIADEPNNALIILAEPQQYRMLSKIIKHLDVMPLQVLINATIVEVTLTDNLEYGLQWAFNSGNVPGGGGGALGSVIEGLADTAAGAATGGFSYALSGAAENIRLTFDALAKDKKINVLSTPSLMVLNNKEARINVGDSVPFQSSESNNSGGGTIVNSFVQLDTGVILTVKPRVNASGVVILEIEQKVNNATPTAGAPNTPTILKREISTTVAVINGESIVLGGLIRETNTYDNVGIPFLKDIPYLGWLFGSQKKSVAKGELIVIITPRVIANKFDARLVTDEFKRKLTGIYYDEDVFTPSTDQVIRDYNGLEIQTEEQREESIDSDAELILRQRRKFREYDGTTY